MNNITMIQRQIKAFNKALSRALDELDDNYYSAISDLIDVDRMTKKGYGKAGKKYLENMTTEELLAYSADIEQAKNLIELSKISDKLDVEGAKDKASLLWKLYDKLVDAGLPFDSDQVREIIDGEIKIDYKSFALKMNQYLTDEDYGLSDFYEWYNRQAGLNE